MRQEHAVIVKGWRYNIHCISHIKGTASAVFVISHHKRECYMGNIALGGGVERTIQNEAAILCVVAELITFLEMFVNLPF